MPDNEFERLRALQLMQVLDTPADPRLDKLTRLVQKVFEVPIALVSLVDENRQWFKSRCGLDIEETPREVSFCGHTILKDDVFVVEDTHSDPRFADNPLVTRKPHIRFYAGFPLRAPSGHRVGTMCIIDSKPREFTEREHGLLTDLAQVAQQQLTAIAHATVDELTKVANRRGFYQLACRDLSAARAAGSPSTLLLLDLAGFKNVNDEFGHEAGDTTLAQFARMLLLSSGKADTVGRLGGDEFAVFMPGAGHDMAKDLVRRLVGRTAELNGFGTVPVALRFTVGVAVAEAAAHESLDALIGRADAELYANKRRGRVTQLQRASV